MSKIHPSCKSAGVLENNSSRMSSNSVVSGLLAPAPRSNDLTNSATGGVSKVHSLEASVATAVVVGEQQKQNLELASLFECPVCFDYALPPIMQCQSGHIVCATCRAKLNSCPTCRGNLGNIRNLAMEKLAANVLFPCKYMSNGCLETLQHTTKAEHEDVCEFRPYTCPCPGASCKWQGNLEQVMQHLLHQHKSITILQGEDIVFLATDINLPGAVDWVMMQSCFGHHFMLVLEKQDRVDAQMFYAIVQLIGTRKQAEQFAYRLELNGQRRRLTWEATPRSIHDGVHAAISNSDCLVFDSNIASLFAENGNLGINVTISLAQLHPHGTAMTAASVAAAAVAAANAAAAAAANAASAAAAAAAQAVPPPAPPSASLC